MNLNSLRAEVEKDVFIDKSDPSKTAVNVPLLHNKYLTILSDSQMRLLKVQSEYDTLYREKYLYYRNDYPVVLKGRSEVEVLLNGDEELQKLKIKLEYEKHICSYLESVLKQINQLSFHVKSVIEWERFKQGEF